MQESTKAMFKKHRWRVDRAIHNYLYFVFYYPYVKAFHVALSWVDKNPYRFSFLTPILRAVIERYHAKVLSFRDTKKILVLNQDLSATSGESRKIIPFRHAHKILFDEPHCIAVMDCPCKMAMGTAEETIQSCLAVGKQLSTFWMDHCGKYHPRRISQEEALDLVKRFRSKGHITQAFFKVATGGRTGVICNCHPDSCVSLYGTMVAKKLHKGLSQSISSGYSVECDAAKCTLCGDCVEACHFGSIAIHDGTRAYDRGACLGCELCVERCPEEALTLILDSEKPSPLDVEAVKGHLPIAPQKAHLP